MDCPFGIGRIGRGPDGLAAHVCQVRPARRLVGRSATEMTHTRQHLNNIREILKLEQERRDERSPLDRAADWVIRIASGPVFIAVHLLWFAVWISLNVTGGASFDPTFNVLMLTVSLEAIVLTGFVLRAQRHLTLQTEQRAHLDLQLNILAEQELTAILRVVCVLGERLGIDVAKCDPNVEQFRAQTDVRKIAAAIASEQAAGEK
jgi:uncharacterized membrane protein